MQQLTLGESGGDITYMCICRREGEVSIYAVYTQNLLLQQLQVSVTPDQSSLLPQVTVHFPTNEK